MFKKLCIVGMLLGLSVGANAASHSRAHQGQTPSVKTEQAVSTPVNINEADASSLEAVKGIGPKRAAAIVAYRQANGNFKTVDDLVNVKGIGQKQLAKIHNNLSV